MSQRGVLWDLIKGEVQLGVFRESAIAGENTRIPSTTGSHAPGLHRVICLKGRRPGPLPGIGQHVIRNRKSVAVDVGNGTSNDIAVKSVRLDRVASEACLETECFVYHLKMQRGRMCELTNIVMTRHNCV